MKINTLTTNRIIIYLNITTDVVINVNTNVVTNFNVIINEKTYLITNLKLYHYNVKYFNLSDVYSLKFIYLNLLFNLNY